MHAGGSKLAAAAAGRIIGGGGGRVGGGGGWLPALTRRGGVISSVWCVMRGGGMGICPEFLLCHIHKHTPFFLSHVIAPDMRHPEPTASPLLPHRTPPPSTQPSLTKFLFSCATPPQRICA
jgi:hypothetical protein